MPLPPEDGSSLESLVEESLKRVPSFPANAKAGKTLRQRLLGKLPAISAAVFGAAFSIPGNPVGTPAVMGALTYALADTASRMRKRDRASEKRTVDREGAGAAYYGFFSLKPLFSAISAATALSVSVSLATKDMGLGSDVASYYSGLLRHFPDIMPLLSYSLANGLGAYVLLSGAERVFHPDSVKVIAGRVRHRFYKATRQPQKAAASLEQIVSVPHSREAEVSALLQLGDDYLEAGQNEEAANADKRMLDAAKRKDGSLGVSDWPVGKVTKQNQKTGGRSSISDGETPYVKLQRAMHRFAAGNYPEAHAMLTELVAADPENRQRRRVRALFFEATGNDALADLEMRIYEAQLRNDNGLAYRLVGESRNDVLVPKSETKAMPDVYVKRSKNRLSLEEEVRNIAAFSGRQHGRLPRVMGQRLDGEYHGLSLESLGEATMHQKALAGTLTYSDIKSVIDMLVDTIADGEALAKEGKIRVSEPISAEKYTYTVAEGLADGQSAEQQNSFEGESIYFVNRLVDIFALRVQKSNKIEFSPGFMEALVKGAMTINATLCSDKFLNFAYTDFNPRNIIFSSLHGDLVGKVDWEQIRKAPVVLELVNILEFYGSNLGPVVHRELMGHFIRRMEKEFTMKINEKKFALLYEVAAVARHLELTGYMSRDSETNPEYNRAQVYNYLRARMHLASLIRSASKESGDVKGSLEGMLSALESTPILKDAALQRRLEQEIVSRLHLSTAYSLRELGQKRFWLEMLSDIKPEALGQLFRPITFKADDIALPAVMLVGLPATLGSLAAYAIASYAAIGAVMPALPVP